MNKSRWMSIIAITLLLLQLFSSEAVLLVQAQNNPIEDSTEEVNVIVDDSAYVDDTSSDLIDGLNTYETADNVSIDEDSNNEEDRLSEEDELSEEVQESDEDSEIQEPETSDEENATVEENDQPEEKNDGDQDPTNELENEINDSDEELLDQEPQIYQPTRTNFQVLNTAGLEWPDPGSLRLDKVAEETGKYAEWEVELTVEGKNLKTSSDIVIVFDRSNSMYTSRLTKAKAAAKQFVDNLLIDENSTVRIALVPFGTNADTHTDFQGFSGKQHLKDQIEAIKVTGGNDGGTNIQAGLRSASNLLSSSQATQRTIVLMSDGAPTYSFKAQNATAYSWPENKYNFILDNPTNTRIGNGSDYNLPPRSCILIWCSGDSYTVNGYEVRDNGIATISEAQNIIQSGIDIYSIGLEVGNDENAIYTLDNSQNKGYFAGGDDDMTPIFEEIAASIANAATQAIVTDPLGDMFNLVKDGSYNGSNFEASHGTVTWDDGTETFTWNIGSIKEGEKYTLKYKVTIDWGANPKGNVLYPLNKETPLNYKDPNGENQTKQFPIPEGQIETGKIDRLGYRVNVDGDPVDDSGNVVSSPEEAQRFYFDVFGEDLQFNQTYDVPAGDTPNGYQLHEGTDSTKVLLETGSPYVIVEFGYVKTSELPAKNVTAIYVDEDNEEIAGSETFTGNIGDSYTTVQKDIPGYEFVELGEGSASVTGTFTSEEQTVIYVYRKLLGKIKIIKVDEDDSSKLLEGAKFAIIDKDDEEVGTLTTDSNGEAISDDLPIGEYTLVETEAPYGYKLSEGQNLTVVVEAGKDNTITITNEKLKGSIKIIKVDSEDNEIVLEGAEFQLKDENEDEVATGTTTSTGELIFTDIVVGKYTLVETKAPNGYRLLGKEIEIEITPDNLTVSKTIENSEQGWEIPKTGGMGTLGFYGVGLFLMTIAVLFIIRRRHI